MPLRYLIDENLRGPFWTAMVQANSERALPIEIACVGEYGVPRLASLDTDILIWAEQQGYVVVSGDLKTMPGTLAWFHGDGQGVSFFTDRPLPGRGAERYDDLSRRSACAVSVSESSCNRFSRRYD